eukprot:gene30363-36687_t
MDIEWVLQVSSFKFDGFLIEVLGFAERLHNAFPLLRLVKSSYVKSLDELSIAPKSKLLSELFDEERLIVNKLMSTAFNRTYFAHLQPAESLFSGQSKPISRLECVEQYDSALVQTILDSPKLSKYEVANVQSVSDCCDACQKSPFCSYYMHNMSSQVCQLKSAHAPISILPVQTPNLTQIQVGSVPSRAILPRAIIFHGTLCVYHNTTLSRRRDINTIYIGRYMVERSAFSKGLTMGDLATVYCAGLMDELWVPTEWHRYVISQMLERMGGGGRPSIVVVPEAVDTKLFDRSLEVELTGGSEKRCDAGTALVCFDEDNHRVPFVFLSVFKWEERKGWDILLNAYWKAFSKDDDVILLIHSHLPPPHTQYSDINQLIADYALRMFDTSIENLAAVHWIDNLRNAYHSKLIHHIGWHKLLSTKLPSGRRLVDAGLTRRQVR